MRVLIDYRSALRSRSGVGEYTHGLVRALARLPPGRQLEITIFSSSWKDRLEVPSDLGPVKSVDLRLPVAGLNLAWHRLGWPPAEMLTRARYDVTHSMHPLLLPSRKAAGVVTIHDLNFLTHPERTRGEIRRDYGSLARIHAHRADHIIVVSRFTAGQVEAQLEVPRSRISVCSPGAPEWSPRSSAPDGGYMLFFGTLEPRKNVGWLLDAYERLLSRAPVENGAGQRSRIGSALTDKSRPAIGDVPELVLAGKSTPDAQPWLDRIARPPLAGHVRHVGYVEPGTRRSLYLGACLLVQPSFEEGFGIPALEAMTLGVPVVAANRGALPEVVGDAGLLVDGTDAEHLACALARMIGEPAMAASCAARGVIRARQFQWADTATRVREAYERAVEHRSRRSA